MQDCVSQPNVANEERLIMNTYFAVVHKDAGSAYGVRFPDIPGCFSAADDLDDVLANAAEALALWAEDSELPAPRDADEIAAELVGDLNKGAFLIAVPYIEDDTRTKRINISIGAGLLEAIDATAKTRGQTRSAFLANAARRAIHG